MPTRTLLALLTTLAAAAPAAAGLTSAQKCEKAAANALATCLQRVAKASRRCYLDTGHACPPGDTSVTKALGTLAGTVQKKCASAADVQGAGYGALMTPTSLAARLGESCAGEPATLAARSFGGPQAAVLAGATPDVHECLDTASDEAAKLIVATVKGDNGCIARAHAGRTCDTAKTADKIARTRTKAAAKIDDACPPSGDQALDKLIGLGTSLYLARADEQARCAVATANGDAGPLALGCGPRPEVAIPARGQWVQVTLDESVWGTRCGDGSPYAFWIRLAPDGSPPERVVIDLAGGGACIFESQCTGVPPSLFMATDDPAPSGGYMSLDPSISPFTEWTHIYLPYCTQDVHFGGGLTSTFPSITVHRFGAVNLRATMRYLRDVLWPTLDATSADGWRPDRLQVVFAGESAGGFGVNYNYHYLLDDLRWIHTTAVPDSGIAVGAGVMALGGLVQGTDSPFGWGVRPFEAPYCLDTDCAVGPILQTSSVPRLKATPEQQFLNVSNQVDATQTSTTLFPDLASWTNALRQAYCDTRGMTGIRYFLPASSTPIHTLLRSDTRYTTLLAGGIAVREWINGALANPDDVHDEVDEGTIVTDVPGVNPFPCTLGSP